MLKDKAIGFIGCGNLAEAIIKGLLSSGLVSAGRIIATDRIPGRLEHVAEAYKIEVFNKISTVAGRADIIFIAVKPGDVPEVLAELAEEFLDDTGKLLISVAAGVMTAAIQDGLRQGGTKRLVPVIRAMPNTPVIVREGVTALCAGAGAGTADIDAAGELFGAVGKVVTIEDEALMDAVTGLSGSGPAYIFLILEALVEAGVEVGLPRKSAEVLAVQTTLGAAKLALTGDRDLKGLREMVTSPGGTTVEGLKVLEGAGIRKTLADAVAAATKRARELSGA